MTDRSDGRDPPGRARRDPGDDEDAIGGAALRTDLAWSRSGLALAAMCAAVLKVLVDVEDRRAPLVIAAVLVAGTAAWLLAVVEARLVSSASMVGRLHRSRRKLQAVACVTTAFAAGALVLALLPTR
jgi:hypothetical protein